MSGSNLKERECPGCKRIVTPVLIPNTLQGAPFYGFGKVGFGENSNRNYLIKCPKCGYLMGSK